MLETQVWSLGWEDPLEKEMTTHSSILSCRIPWTEEPGRLQSMGLQRVGHDWATSLASLTACYICHYVLCIFSIKTPWEQFILCCCCSVACRTLRPHGLLHTRLPCPFTVFQSLPKLMSIESMMPVNHLILCHSLLLLPSIFPSIRAFSNELALHIRWPKYWSVSFSISPSNIIQGRFPLGLTDWISLQSKGLSRVFSSTTVWKHQFHIINAEFYIFKCSHYILLCGLHNYYINSYWWIVSCLCTMSIIIDIPVNLCECKSERGFPGGSYD